MLISCMLPWAVCSGHMLPPCCHSCHPPPPLCLRTSELSLALRFTWEGGGHWGRGTARSVVKALLTPPPPHEPTHPTNTHTHTDMATTAWGNCEHANILKLPAQMGPGLLGSLLGGGRAPPPPKKKALPPPYKYYL